ncbi:MAG: alpha/beta hydrolase [Deltaproteobacteria bacterium]|nr:alpha/beta hydrolase [Deltaproteobacteria bacterium]
MEVKWPYLLCLVLFLMASCYIFYPKIENFFVFFPESFLELTPKDLHLSYKDVYLNTEDGKRLHGWFFPLKKEYPVILFCHGNAGNISHRLDNVKMLLEQKLQVFIFDYRGFGKSTGSPSEKGLYLDGLAAYDYLVVKENIPSGNIIPFGRSLGAAVAIDIALKRDIRSIIIESGFTSIKGMAKTMFLYNLFSYIVPPNYNNLQKIADIKVPKLIIHSEDDEIVPFSMGKRLFEAAKDPKYFFRIKGAGHNDTYIVGGVEYLRSFALFSKDSRI